MSVTHLCSDLFAHVKKKKNTYTQMFVPKAQTGQNTFKYAAKSTWNYLQKGLKLS